MPRAFLSGKIHPPSPTVAVLATLSGLGTTQETTPRATRWCRIRPTVLSDTAKPSAP